MNWESPPIIKVYEALGAISDERVHIDGNGAKVYSSSGNKYYDVLYDPESQSIMANDNGSYWQDYLGYPSIAFLLKGGVIAYRQELADLLKDIAWKDINQMYKNDFDKTLEHILKGLDKPERKDLQAMVEEISLDLDKLELKKLGKKIKPPAGY